MAKLEIPVKVYFGEIDEIIRELKQLQTYKLFEGAEEVLVEIDEVARVLANHIKATPAEPETAKRIVGKSRNGMTLWYQCDMCNEPVDAQDDFCRGCGRRLTDG